MAEERHPFLLLCADMCGLAGFIGEKPPASVLAKMIGSIECRGPDETRFLSLDGFEAAFCRLAIVDLEHGRQPVWNRDGSVCCLFNGEIYNYRQLAEGQAASEAAVILSYYETYGLALTDYLDGVFAIVLFDSHKRTCYLFRDYCGVKPLYYSLDNNRRTLLFSSEIRSFFNVPGFGATLDLTALAEKYALDFWDRDKTFFCEIKQVPPGSCLEARLPPDNSGGEVDISTHSSNPVPDILPPETDDLSPERITVLLKQAVEKRLQHSQVFPMVLTLSGGIDSTLLLLLMLNRDRDSWAALTLADSTGTADKYFAGLLAEKLGFRHAVFTISASSFLAELPQMVLASGGNGPVYSPYLLGKGMQEFFPRARVMLCGEGADEFFLGYPLFLNPEKYLTRIRRAAQNLKAKGMLSPLLQRTLDLSCPACRDPLPELASLFQNEQLLNRHLLNFDHGPMHFSKECRVPFLDRDLVGTLQRLPDQVKILDGNTKIILKVIIRELASVYKQFPQTVLDRPSVPAYRATSVIRRNLGKIVIERLKGCPFLKHPGLAYTRNPEEILWIGGSIVIFLHHKGCITGMTFDDLMDEIGCLHPDEGL